jgi:hypothetical protein
MAEEFGGLTVRGPPKRVKPGSDPAPTWAAADPPDRRSDEATA